jgi:mannose-1-phosphate guanylyltransferase
MVIGLESHARFLEQEFGSGSEPIVLRQPESRGTAAAVLLAAQWLQAHDPGATAVFCPSDHFVSDDAPFMAQVAEIVRFVQRQPQWLVLLGVEPDRPETEYGWIEPGACLDCRVRWPLYRVARFREKPSEAVARGLFRSGWLWNTLVFAASIPALLASGRACVPSLSDWLGRLQAFWGSVDERWALRQAYALAPTVSFSQSILETCAQPLAVSKVIGLSWRDLGTPERVLETMGAFRSQAPWLAEVKA